jgi:hypothetical protein
MRFFGMAQRVRLLTLIATVLGHKSPAAGFPHQNHDIKALIINELRILIDL